MSDEGSQTSPQPQEPAPRQDPQRPLRRGGSDLQRNAKTAAWVFVAVITTIFLLRNAQSVEVDFVFTSVDMPLFIVLGATLILGAVLALGAQGLRHRRKTKAAKEALRELKREER